MKKLLHSLALWLARKTYPSALTGGQWSGTAFLDAYKRNRNPTPNELLSELKNTAWTCASINAAVCASFPPRLYVSTSKNQASPRCLARSLGAAERRRLEQRFQSRNLRSATVEEVVDHPLLTLLRQVNPALTNFDLWELTELYLEVH